MSAPSPARRSALLRLPREVWLLGGISLVNDGASDLIYPLLPLYLTSVLGAGPAALGLIEGIAEATSSLLRLPAGVLSDRTGHTKPWIVAGYGLAGLARPLIGLAGSWPQVLLLRFGDRVGKGLRSAPRDALLAAAVAPNQRGLAFGLHRAMDNGGAVLGPLVAAALLALQVPLRSILLASLLPGLLCLALALSLRERPPLEMPCLQQDPALPSSSPEPSPASGQVPVTPMAEPAADPGSTASQDWRFAALPQGLQRYLLVVALFTAGNASNLFLLLRARELGVGQAQIPLLWACISAVAMLGAVPLAALSDRFGRRRLLLGGYLGYGLLYLLIGQLSHGGVSLYPLFAAYGLVLAATEGVEKALVADLAPPEQRGTAFGWFHLTTGVMLLPASLLFGWLSQRAGSPLAFSVAGGFALLAALLLALQPGIGAPFRSSGSALVGR